MNKLYYDQQPISAYSMANLQVLNTLVHTW